MEKLPPLAALKAFEAVARLGSVTKAAEELHLTHSAVSHQLKALEEHLGLMLFQRHGKRLTVTEDGRVYALRVRLALREIGAATTDVLASPRADELVIATIPSFGARWLMPRLPRFMAAHPDLKITVRASLDLVDLQRERVDVAIRMGAGSWENTHSQLLFVDELIMVAAPHFNGGKLPRTAKALQRAVTAMTPEVWNLWQNAAGLGEYEPCGPRFNDSNLALAAVESGYAITLTRRSLVADALQQGKLIQLSNVVVPHPNPTWLVWPQRSHGLAKLTAFSDWLAAEVASYQRHLAATNDA